MNDERLGTEIEKLRTTLRILRGENGCPWDRARTAGEMISHLIEEAYELLQAEAAGDLGHIEEELGDVLFLIVFIHELMLERRGAPLSSIVEAAHGKIVSRHPHVFGGTSASDETQSQAEWDRMKREERRARAAGPETILSSVPSGLPPLRRALAVQKKAAAAGFDWPDHRGVIDKLGEEAAELADAVDAGERDHVREEIGDLLFTVVNVARYLDIDCESALEQSTAKFIRRFDEIEERAAAGGTPLPTLTLEQMESLWQSAKGKGGK
ncbi:MAG: nucleoside triphosphate pyrophosphohydrolase [Candidatus Krumholzibacteria bacterium]|nr:nucleoside triphosphate pyrophosphohydrolase [Candidatus Krumholzibacteria bacterium]